MKKIIYILAVVFLTTSLVGCQKETLETEDPHTSYFYSLKGEKHAHIKAEIYESSESGEASCAGYFINPLNEHFDFIIEIEGGIPEEILNDPNLNEMEFDLDIEFLGLAYNCNRSYKTEPDVNKGYPVEIQKAKITRCIETH